MNEWYAHVTVATVIENNGKFLLVHEQTDNGEKYNQPAGHLEPNETLFEAALRETKEETGWNVELTGLVRINQYTAPSNGVTYLRVTFSARPLAHNADAKLDTGIIEAKWFSLEEIKQLGNKLRSPLVLSDIEFNLTQPKLPLNYVNCYQPSK